MKYEGIDLWNSPHLEHWGKKDKHKYIAKEKINGKYRYFYSLDEYRWYLNNSSRDNHNIKSDAANRVQYMELDQDSGVRAPKNTLVDMRERKVPVDRRHPNEAYYPQKAPAGSREASIDIQDTLGKNRTITSGLVATPGNDLVRETRITKKGGRVTGIDSKLFTRKSFLNPSVKSTDTDARWAINSAYKPEATKNEKKYQAAKNRAATGNYIKKPKKKSGVDVAKKWLQGFFNR